MRIIYYDLETTGLGPVSGADCVEIVQICATTSYRGTRKIFECYLAPTVTIDQGATNTHGLTNRKLRKMLQNGEASYPQDGLRYFVDFIDQIVDEDSQGSVILVAHRNHQFDFPILESNLFKFGVPFPESSVGLFDSLDLMKKVKAAEPTLTRINLNACLKFFFKGECQQTPHDAWHDANDVRRISEAGAKKLGYGSLRHFLQENSNYVKEWL